MFANAGVAMIGAMLGNASPTPFDLRFSLFGIPVRVHPLFWLLPVLLGRNLGDLNAILLLVMCVFVSVLVHELGHALTTRYFGWRPEIVLYLFGGYASFVPTWGYTTLRAITILLAGPGAGFMLYGATWCIRWLVIHFRLVPADGAQLRLLDFFFDQMLFINLWWGVFNLLPIYPLDGGRISRELLTHFRRHDGLKISLILSILVAGALAGYSLSERNTFNAMMCASLAFESFQHLQGDRYR
ncbi:MAG: Zn-dependent protease [Planctomycetaceae bacterium]|nr:Zn-dependent protease [Planctomycetaceae bacterium]